MNENNVTTAGGDVKRFIKAQEGACGATYDDALQEIRQGLKTSHWIWYIFPQIYGLGHSAMSKYFAIADRAEAERYLQDATLNARLNEICQALLQVEGRTALQILGKVDAAKVRSSMTLFDAVCPGAVFASVLDKYYAGERCSFTLNALSVPVAEVQPAAEPAPAQPDVTEHNVTPQPPKSLGERLWNRVTGWFK